MENREFWLQIPYDDIIKFPYGFSRSGIFSLSQSQMLEDSGCLIHALLNDQVSNPSQSDIALLNAIRCGEICDNELVNIWLKYAGYNRKICSVADINSQSVEKRQILSSDNFTMAEDDQLLPEQESLTDEYLHAS